MDFSFLTGCASAFWQITSGVCRAVAACLGGGGRPARLPDDLVMEVHRRVTRAQNLLLALMARVRSGTQRGGWTRVAPVVAAGDPVRAPRAAVMVLPRRFGWLVHLVGYEAAGRGSQLAHLLAEPEMVDLVRDVPQARRILRPLCRMLGVACAGLRGVARVRRARVVVAAGGGGSVPKRVVEGWRIPLPRGVLSAARRAGFGKIPEF